MQFRCNYDAIMINIRSTYQEFDQQVISQINRLMDKQRLSRCTYDVIKLQFRWNLNKIWMQFRLYLDKRFKSLINR